MFRASSHSLLALCSRYASRTQVFEILNLFVEAIRTETGALSDRFDNPILSPSFADMGIFFDDHLSPHSLDVEAERKSSVDSLIARSVARDKRKSETAPSSISVAVTGRGDTKEAASE